jgi:hypothetical protein
MADAKCDGKLRLPVAITALRLLKRVAVERAARGVAGRNGHPPRGKRGMGQRFIDTR